MTSERSPSTRGLIDADVGPLRRFTGILDSMPTETQSGGQGESAYERSVDLLNFKDIDVKEAVEPYHFPTYTIRVGQSNRKKSRWGFLSEGSKEEPNVGFNNVADQQYTSEQLDRDNPNFIKPTDRMDIKDCIGKRISMVMADEEDGRPKKPILYNGREDVPTLAWTVYEIEGIGVAGGQGKSAMDVAMGLLDGKTLADFNTAALANPIVRADIPLLQSISKPPSAADSFANTMLTAGKFTKDAQEIYHKV